MSFFIKGTYSVTVAGQDVTSRFQPLLKSLQVERAAGEASDSCTMVLADQDGRIALPQERAPVTVTLNGQWAFEGFVSDLSCSLSKSGGREMKISASSIDRGGKAKQPSLRHMDDASLKEVMQNWGAKAGVQMEVLGSLASIERKYWLQQNESFVSWGQRIAREVGGTFKIVGARGFLSPRNEGLSSSGRALTPISATVGDNLIDCDISPITSKPRYSKVQLSYFDRAKGERVQVEVDTGIENVDATLRSLITSADEPQSKSRSEALSKSSDRARGRGDVTIIGDARAEPEAVCNVRGVRPGVDGDYQIDSVSHSITKGGGFTTSLGLKQPKAGAGADAR